jgi:hypothetical protein
MGCQRDEGAGQTPRRVRLTDQALVAVTLARRVAAAHGRPPTSGDLLVGLAAEPDGWAGHLLRRNGTAAAALSQRAGSLPPALGALEEVVAAAADRAAPRPPGTVDLLTAALTIGGADLDDLLAACGYDHADVWPDEGWDDPRGAEDDRAWTFTAETLTLDDPDGPALTPAAARAVARTRAAGGGAVELVALLLDEPGLRGGHPTGGPVLATGREHEPWDAGLAPVLEVAAVLADGDAASTYHLLQAAVVAGGRGPRARLSRPDDAEEGPRR